MDDNSFLSGYNKKADPPKKKIEVKDVEKPSLKYEQKSGFKKPQKKSTGHSPSPNIKPKTIIWVAACVVILIAVVIGLLLMLGGGGVEMKDFEGWAISDVQLWANENKVRLQVEEQYSDTFAENEVISQSIAQGEKIKQGDFVRLTVSLGHDLTVMLPLPDLMSMTKEQIEAWAEENFMTKVRFTTEYSSEIAAGYVIRFEINDNTVVDEVRRDTPVYIVVSKGMEDETAIEITVPDFKTMSISECYVFANDNGLLLTVEERYDDYVPEGTVISQSVKAESKVKKGDEIALVLSKGKMITMPDFSEYSKDRAVSVAGELGIPVTVKERYSSSSAGAFISQSIDPGTVLEEGDNLELCYSIGNKIVLSSFVGQTRDAIESWAKELNELGAKITIKATSTQNNAPAGTIIHQDIANQTIGRGTTINIIVSKGKVIFVPDFVAEGSGYGYDVAITREKALQICEELGLIPIFEKSENASRLRGEIWQQSLLAGSEVYEGSTITLKYTPTETTMVPDFTVYTKDEVLDGGWLQLLNIVFEESEEVVDQEGKICAQSIAKDTSVVKGSTIILTVGTVAAAEPTPTPTPMPTPTPTPAPT